jgi:hypothetical protein
MFSQAIIFLKALTSLLISFACVGSPSFLSIVFTANLKVFYANGQVLKYNPTDALAPKPMYFSNLNLSLNLGEMMPQYTKSFFLNVKKSSIEKVVMT